MPEEISAPPSPSQPASPRRWLRAIDALVLAALICPGLLFAMVATYDRQQVLAAAGREILATLDTLHGHAENIFDFQVLALGAADERLQGLSAEEVLAGAPQYRSYLRALRLYSDDKLGIVVFGPDGRALMDSNSADTMPNFDVSDRAYFQWHREHPGPEPYVAGLLRSRRNGQPVIFVTRRRSSPEGAFLGVIAAGVEQRTFTEQWNRTALMPDALISLVHQDGTILASRPATEPQKDKGIRQNGVLARAMASGTENVVSRQSTTDGASYLVAYRQLTGFPVDIAYAMSRGTVLASWRNRLVFYGGFAVAACIALSSLAMLARRHALALHELNASLERRVQERTAEIRASESRVRMLAREVDHRAKNALAVVQATLRLTPRADITTYIQSVEGRVAALSRVQTLLAEHHWRGASLPALLEAELKPFVSDAGEASGTRAEMQGPPLLMPPTLAQPLAMVIHELATNALKHGALSCPGGQITISWRSAKPAGSTTESLALRWAESGGPPIAHPPGKLGFGSRVLQSVVRGQLGGSLTQSWRESGMVCEMEIPLTRAASPAPA